jgi:hypothetical protein
MTDETTKARTEPGVRTYTGGCHCGAVRFEARLDLAQGGTKCNCSICSKTAFWGTIVKPADFELLSGQDDLSDYQFASKSGHHYFCRRCGVRSFGSGDLEMLGGLYYSVNLQCLDGVHLTDLPRKYWDGKNNAWMNGPSDSPIDGGAW